MTSSRKHCRDGDTKCAPRSPREALYCQINHSDMSRESLAEVMDINPATLTKWGDPQGGDKIPDDRLTHLMHLTDDNPAYVTFFATLQGLIVYDPKTAPKGVTKLVTDFGELLKAIDERTDGTTIAEANRIEREGSELIAAVRQEIDEAKRVACPPTMDDLRRELGPRQMARA